MGETFYSVLEVSAEADTDQIRRAFRQRVKESHPDLNDTDATPREFKRLTTARDVLLDADERSSYDRLGHSTYVDRHVDAAVWGREWKETMHSCADTAGQSVAQTANQSPSRADSTQTSNTSGRYSAAWFSTAEYRQNTHTSASENVDASQQSETASWAQSNTRNGHITESWQRAPNAYKSNSPYVEDDSRRSWPSAAGVVQQMGLWLVVHLILVISAIITGMLLLSSVNADPIITAATTFFIMLLIGVFIGISMFHVLLELY